ncbi:hypothetical protein Avbf_18061 [Armadillidium vulgare]|nr:hypothetical protein Avbf_18061 [Armadillidium vulgare]
MMAPKMTKKRNVQNQFQFSFWMTKRHLKTD